MNAILPATDDPDSAGFWQAAGEGRLVVQEAGGRLFFPPRPGLPEASWREVSGRGRIWSFIVVHGPTLPAFADRVPFPVAIVELEEGEHLRMVGNLIDAPGATIDSVPCESVEVGMPVRVSFERVADDISLPCWIPVAQDEMPYRKNPLSQPSGDL